MPNKIQIVNMEIIRQKIKNLMKLQNLDYGDLSEAFDKTIINEKKYEITKSNIRMYIEQRNLSIDFLYVLSKVFNVSLDYLIDENIEINYTDGFDYNFAGERYSKYIGHYYFYYCPTRNNEQTQPLTKATLSINNFYEGGITLSIPTDEENKTYKGSLIISHNTRKVFMRLRDKKGEIVQLIFSDQFLFIHSFEFAIGMALSLSAGELKHLAVTNRFCLSKKLLSSSGLNFLATHLKLNYKFIHIQKEVIRRLLSDIFPEKSDNMFEQLSSAFKPKEIMSLDEGYLMNTIERDYSEEFKNIDIEFFISKLRENSYMCQANSKVKDDLDSQIFSYLERNDGFEQP